MRVGMYYNNRDVRVEEMPIPRIGPGELLVKVKASGICGSDLMEWYRVKKAPLVLGHEITGEIVELGEGVEKDKEGERVFVSHHVPCNTCRYCLDGQHTVCETLQRTNYDPGGFAQYIRVPRINVDRGVFRLPDEIPNEEGTLIEPLACVVRGQRLAPIEPARSLLVIGSGISGLLHLRLARALGAARIIATDISQYRLKAAKEFGADGVINAKEDVPKQVRKINDGRLADLVIICTTSLSAFTQGLQSVDKGGTILLFAPTELGVDLPLPANDFWRKSIRLIFSYGAGPLDIATAIELLRFKRMELKEMITHRLSLEQIGLGFRLAAEAEECIKVIIKPNG
ncbi:alcohol dehydrogenase catalytic domain-containing protein [bacterium]|nr:alcohol dehydrogenase catalytic domain-containing protein [bacterium]